MPQRRYTPDEKTHALDLYTAHGPAEAARLTGIPAPTIRSWASRNHLTDERNATVAAAVAARKLSFEERRAALADRLLAEAEVALTHELGRLDQADLRDLVGARTRAIHDHLLLAGEATARHEHVTVDAVDAEIARLEAELAGNDPAEAAPVGPA